MAVRLSRRLLSLLPAILLGRERSAAGPQSEADIVAAMGRSISEAISKARQDWKGVAIFIEPKKEGLSSHGWVFYGDARREALFTTAIPDDVLFKAYDLKKLTEQERGNWKRLLLKIRNGDNDIGASYIFDDFGEWPLLGADTGDEIEKIIEDLRP